MSELSNRDRAEIFGAHSFAIIGDHGTAKTGYDGLSAAGDHSSAITGDCGIAIAGYKGQSMSGEAGCSITGDHGTALSGEQGIIAIKRWDGVRYRLVVGYVGENGIKPYVSYRLDKEDHFIEASNEIT